jgi:hypothetical protein
MLVLPRQHKLSGVPQPTRCLVVKRQLVQIHPARTFAPSNLASHKGPDLADNVGQVLFREKEERGVERKEQSEVEFLIRDGRERKKGNIVTRSNNKLQALALFPTLPPSLPPSLLKLSGASIAR